MKKTATTTSATQVPSQIVGLTSDEVARRRAAGEVNTNTDAKTLSVAEIVSKHTFTLFNGVTLGLAVLIVFTGSLRNLAFMGVVLTNFLIGVIQELRAKRMVDKLSILTADKVRVVRDACMHEVPLDELVLDDVIMLSHGDQIPADCVVLEGTPQVDESLLTGESELIDKREGDELLSGSFISTGSVVARVVRVGLDGFAAKINAEAHSTKEFSSEIMDSLRLVIKLATYLLIPLGIALFLRTFLKGETSLNDAILSTVAALLGMIPQGLVLLTSTVFALATTRLAHHKVLVQQTYCIETLARVDTLCIDKTGTITTGAMEVVGMVGPHGEDLTDADASQLARVCMSICEANAADENQTSATLRSYLTSLGVKRHEVAEAIAFSSEKKFSGCILFSGGCYLMGAAQFLLTHEQLDSFEQMRKHQDTAARILCVVKVSGMSQDGAPVGDPEILGYVILQDEIRPTAAETIQYFKDQGVNIKVISGDDPTTVGAIAERVGIENAGRVCDATQLETMDDIRIASMTASVFGRVTPHQKRELVSALQEQGHIVAMTGDGVNDILALRRSDCSIAMASGAAASRNIAEIVLVDNDFAHLPQVVAEGRRSINNLQRSASLFLVKTVYSALLSLICVFLPPYPFIPIQLTLISAAVIGMPSFALALERNHERVRGSFLNNVLMRSLPASATIVIVLGVTLFLRWLNFFTFDEASTLSMYLCALIGLALIVRISVPLNLYRTLVSALVVAIMLLGTMVFPQFFMVQDMSVSMALYFGAQGVASLVIFHILSEGMQAGAGNVLTRIADKLEELL
ncbi:MAG: HAD-IC family P-type ATPase [Atopobiaceae bacterium]